MSLELAPGRGLAHSFARKRRTHAHERGARATPERVLLFLTTSAPPYFALPTSSALPLLPRPFARRSGFPTVPAPSRRPVVVRRFRARRPKFITAVYTVQTYRIYRGSSCVRTIIIIITTTTTTTTMYSINSRDSHKLRRPAADEDGKPTEPFLRGFPYEQTRTQWFSLIIQR